MDSDRGFEDVKEGKLLWKPSEGRIAESNIKKYEGWLAEKKGLGFNDYEELRRWSVSDVGAFWESIWEYFDVNASSGYSDVLDSPHMPGAEWFSGAKLNYVQHIFKAGKRQDDSAIVFHSEWGKSGKLSWGDLRTAVAGVTASLKKFGVKRGDRVAGIMANVPEAVIAFLACASMGAVWSCCSLEFGIQSVVDRFSQISPKVLFACDGYFYNGKRYDRMQDIVEVQKLLPTIEWTVVVPNCGIIPETKSLKNAVLWKDAAAVKAELVFEQVPFAHPLWILFSSGTTGLPKPIVHSQGGILLEHLKVLSLHMDLKADDRFFWFTTTGWMMWNYLVGSLMLGTTIVLYDGSPAYPDIGALWNLAEDTGITCFGVSAAYIASCMKAKINPSAMHKYRYLRSIGSTGSPLSPEGFQWIYDNVKGDVLLGSVSGGTDICSLFVGCCPTLPVRAGEIQCRCLGVDVSALDESGKAVVGRMGEMVISQPMPSMPIYFWNDKDGSRYHESYFSMYPGKWRHGDWIKITRRGSCVIYGRSDATLKRHGVRMGSSEIYRAVEAIPDIVECLVVDLEGENGMSYMPLFVVLKAGRELDDSLKSAIRDRIRKELSPKHVPDDIFAVGAIPKTINGKKMEVPVKRILAGMSVEKAASRGSLSNPESLKFFEALRRKMPLKKN